MASNPRAASDRSLVHLAAARADDHRGLGSADVEAEQEAVTHATAI
jgi:hypothetical protein